MDPAYFKKFWRLCPNFVIEWPSPFDVPQTLREKMAEWIANGAELAWLIDPETRTVEIYRPGSAREIVSNATELRGTGPVEGFVLDLAPVWDPMAA